VDKDYLKAVAVKRSGGTPRCLINWCGKKWTK
jgi:hypothetical protein